MGGRAGGVWVSGSLSVHERLLGVYVVSVLALTPINPQSPVPSSWRLKLPEINEV